MNLLAFAFVSEIRTATNLFVFGVVFLFGALIWCIVLATYEWYLIRFKGDGNAFDD